MYHVKNGPIGIPFYKGTKESCKKVESLLIEIQSYLDEAITITDKFGNFRTRLDNLIVEQVPGVEYRKSDSVI